MSRRYSPIRFKKIPMASLGGRPWEFLGYVTAIDVYRYAGANGKVYDVTIARDGTFWYRTLEPSPMVNLSEVSVTSDVPQAPQWLSRNPHAAHRAIIRHFALTTIQDHRRDANV